MYETNVDVGCFEPTVWRTCDHVKVRGQAGAQDLHFAGVTDSVRILNCHRWTIHILETGYHHKLVGLGEPLLVVASLFSFADITSGKPLSLDKPINGNSRRTWRLASC